MVAGKPKVDEKLTAIQPIKPGSGWESSTDSYDKEKIRELKRKIAENFYKEIKSLAVIKDGKLLIEEYFNGAARDTLHDTRPVGTSLRSEATGANGRASLPAINFLAGRSSPLSSFTRHRLPAHVAGNAAPLLPHLARQEVIQRSADDGNGPELPDLVP